MSSGDLADLEHRLGHRFANPELLTRALTHASAVGGSGMPELQTYQRLEFLGDRVLGLAVAHLLLEHFPDAPEGDLSRRLARLVSREMCTEIARDMDLGAHLRVGGGVRKGGSAQPGMLSDACEAVIAAVYLDAGFAVARQVIERFWGARIGSMTGPLRDAKTELQEWAHRRSLTVPVYSEIARSGPDHAPRFEIEVSVDGVAPSRGAGRSKREAEHEAAANLLRREGVWSAA
jgi:ribonuclease-3